MNPLFKSLFKLSGVAVLAMASVLATHSASASTVEPNVISVGTDLTYPPYNYFDESKRPAGFDVEFLTALAQAAQMKVNFLDTRFENLILGIKSNRFDVIASTLYVKPDRAQQITFIPYMKTGVSIAVNKASTFKPQVLEDLCGKKVASIKGAAWLADLKKLSETLCASKGGIDSREFPSSPEATQALLSSGVDVQIEDSAVLQDAALKTGGRVVVTSTQQLYPVVVGLGFNSQNKDLVSVMEKALQKLRDSGEYQKLLGKYNVAAPTAADFKAAITPKAP